MYRAAAEPQSRLNNDFGRGVDALVTVRRSKCVIKMHQFPPVHSICFSNINATVLININANILIPTD